MGKKDEIIIQNSKKLAFYSFAKTAIPDAKKSLKSPYTRQCLPLMLTG